MVENLQQLSRKRKREDECRATEYSQPEPVPHHVTSRNEASIILPASRKDTVIPENQNYSFQRNEPPQKRFKEESNIAEDYATPNDLSPKGLDEHIPAQGPTGSELPVGKATSTYSDKSNTKGDRSDSIRSSELTGRPELTAPSRHVPSPEKAPGIGKFMTQHQSVTLASQDEGASATMSNVKSSATRPRTDSRIENHPPSPVDASLDKMFRDSSREVNANDSEDALHDGTSDGYAADIEFSSNHSELDSENVAESREPPVWSSRKNGPREGSDSSASNERCAKFSEWHANESGDHPDLYTYGPAMITQNYDGEREVLSLLLSHDLMQRMKASIIAGRRFRGMKAEVDEELRQVKLEANFRYGRIMRTSTEIEVVKEQTAKENDGPTEEQRARLKDAQERLEDLKAKQAASQEKRSELKAKLKVEGKEWVRCMRAVDALHQCVLVDCRILSECDQGWWADEDYAITTVKSMQRYDTESEDDGESEFVQPQVITRVEVTRGQGADHQRGQPDAKAASPNVAKGGKTDGIDKSPSDRLQAAPKAHDGEFSAHLEAAEDPVDAPGEKNNPTIPDPAETAQASATLELHKEKLTAELEQRRLMLQKTREQHDKHHDSYTEIYAIYVSQQLNRPNVDFAAEFGPLYVFGGQQLAQKVTLAEEAYATTKAEAEAAGVILGDPHAHEPIETTRPRCEEEEVRYLKKSNHDRIESWRDVEMDDVSLAGTVRSSEAGESHGDDLADKPHRMKRQGETPKHRELSQSLITKYFPMSRLTPAASKKRMRDNDDEHSSSRKCMRFDNPESQPLKSSNDEPPGPNTESPVESSLPESSQLESSQPESSQPESSQPESSQPESSSSSSGIAEIPKPCTPPKKSRAGSRSTKDEPVLKHHFIDSVSVLHTNESRRQLITEWAEKWRGGFL
ncbi:hypothetical protein BU26DRAFT_584327 [Trematosphaeria pertusa]|uniref:Uncharacterized protein n=1 Tax=Trematosphaeria pertusa TaxID=390896 RepID=A0A6A6HX74_9PLEO|nr:uncharacterized protein BU26DRAFT_584327 [Trematosphaeria pertusa]KAF2242193.1 hypothetical protein BU26DRAFT_584327 [Trematosphaeria pertusa]